MVRVEKSAYVGASLERVFGYLKDPMSNVEWLPGMTEVAHVSGEGVGARFRWVYKMAGVPLRGESVILEYLPNERFVTESRGGVASTWTWDFRSENGGTWIDLAVDYEVPIPVVGKSAESVVAKLNERELETGLASIKRRFADGG